MDKVVMDILRQSRKGFLKNEHEHSLKVFVHESEFEEMRAKLKEILPKMFEENGEFSFETKKLLLRANLERFLVRGDVLDADVRDQVDKMLGAGVELESVSDPFKFFEKGVFEIFDAQYNLDYPNHGSKLFFIRFFG